MAPDADGPLGVEQQPRVVVARQVERCRCPCAAGRRNERRRLAWFSPSIGGASRPYVRLVVEAGARPAGTEVSVHQPASHRSKVTVGRAAVGGRRPASGRGPQR